MMPHLAESCWETLGQRQFVAATPWPVADAALVAANTITVAVQVNGKLRGTIVVAPGADSASMEKAALALDTVARALDGKKPRKVIVVPNRIVNVVA
jgi:leucyl-tRNA synthetase